MKSEILEKIDEFGQAVTEMRGDLESRIELLEALQDRPKTANGDMTEAQKKDLDGFMAYLRDGNKELARKAVTVGTTTAGGFAVPEIIDQSIEREMKTGTPWLGLCKVVNAPNIEYRHLVSDRSVTSGTSSETGSRSETATMSFREVQPTYGELYALPKVSNWALQDVFFDLNQFLATEVGDEFAAQVDSQVVSGFGTNEMTGFTTSTPESNSDDGSPIRTAGVFQYVPAGSSSEIPHAPSASPMTYGPDVLINVMKALRAPYRANAVWVMNSNTLATIMQWRDVDGRSYVNYDMSTGAPNQLLGRPLYLSESMADVGSNAFPIAFGDFGRGYLVTRYGEMSVITDPYTTKGHTFIYFAQRYGGKILNDQAVKLLKIATS